MSTSLTSQAEITARNVVDGIATAWASNDPNAFADTYTEDACMILSGNRYFKGRETLRQVVVSQFGSAHKRTTLLQNIIDVRAVSDDAIIVITEGGVLAPGETLPAPERAIHATWVLANDNGSWRIASYQNSRDADSALPGT
jgi:uncharacterized protein (TIGR02246 family)